MTASHVKLLRVSDLPGDRATSFELTPDAETLAGVAQALELSALRKLRFAGKLAPLNARDWRLEAHLGATLVQPCVVTLTPVTTRIDEPVLRTYLAQMPEIEDSDEIEMPHDDSAEALPEVIDLHAVLFEALALAVPAFPRAQGAALGEAVFTEKGAAPLTDAAARPFAGLQSLRDKLADKD